MPVLPPHENRPDAALCRAGFGKKVRGVNEGALIEVRESLKAQAESFPPFFH